MLLNVTVKVMKACVMGSLLHNSETFGEYMPKELESTYIRLLKCCLDVRSSTQNHLVLIESVFAYISIYSLWAIQILQEIC